MGVEMCPRVQDTPSPIGDSFFAGVGGPLGWGLLLDAPLVGSIVLLRCGAR